MSASIKPAIWFPAIRAETGVDVFTQRLCDGLNDRGIRAEITWLPHCAEYLPWVVSIPNPPSWANVVHANTWLHRRLIPQHLPIVATMHLCVHDVSLAPYKRPLQALYHRLWIKPMEAYVMGCAQRIVAVSRYTAERTEEAFGVRNVQVIYNGVQIPDDVDALSERKLHAPFRLLYVGSLSLRKGVDLLGPIMEQLGEAFELWYTADAKPGKIKRSFPSNCKCIGRLDQRQLQSMYREADALLFPSRLEGLPLSVIEAMANGLLPIVSNNSSIPEIVDHDKNGVICASNSVDDFVKSVRELSNNKERWLLNAQRAPLRIKEMFSMDACVEAYAEVYHSILNPKFSLI